MSEQRPLSPQSPNHRGAFINEFPYLQVILFIGIALLTMGLYVYAWIYTRHTMVNRHVDQEVEMPAWLTHSVVALGGISFLLSVIAMFFSQSGLALVLADTSNVLTLITYGMTMVWLFHFRRLLNQLTHSDPKNKLWVNGILLILFSVYYLQYKINQIHDSKDVDEPPASDDEDHHNRSESTEQRTKPGYIEL